MPTDALGRAKLCHKIGNSILKKDASTMNEANKLIKEIALQNYRYKVKQAKTDNEKNWVDARMATNNYAFIFENEVYPIDRRLRVAQKGVTAFLLEDHLHDDMAKALSMLEFLPKQAQMQIKQYIARSVEVAAVMSDLLELFPRNFHGVIRTNFGVDASHKLYKLSNKEIIAFKENNKSGLDAIKQAVIKRMFLS